MEPSLINNRIEKNKKIISLHTEHKDRERDRRGSQCLKLWSEWIAANKESLYPTQPKDRSQCVDYTHDTLILDISDTTEEPIKAIMELALEQSLDVRKTPNGQQLHIIDTNLKESLSAESKDPIFVSFSNFERIRILSNKLENMEGSRVYDIINLWYFAETTSILQFTNVPIEYKKHFSCQKVIERLHKTRITVDFSDNWPKATMTINFSRSTDQNYGLTVYTWEELTVIPVRNTNNLAISVTNR